MKNKIFGKKFGIIFFLGLFTIFIGTTSALALNFGSLFSSGDDKEAIITFMEGHSDWLQESNLLTLVGHGIGWGFVRLLLLLTTSIESLVPQSLSLLGFLNDSGFQGILKTIFNALVGSLLVLTLVWIGIKMIISKEPPKFKSVAVNVMISGLLLMGLPSLMSMLEDMATNFYKGTQQNTTTNSNSLAWELVANNTADLLYVAQHNTDVIKNEDAASGAKNGLQQEKFLMYDLLESITPDTISEIEDSDDSTLLKSLKYTYSSDSDGNGTITEIENGFMSSLSDTMEKGYFRYSAKFAPMILGLMSISVAYLFVIFSFITIIIEIGFKQILASIVFATDLESGQKTKAVMQDILSGFMAIAFTGLSLKLYTIFLTYLSNTDINAIVYIIALVASTFILIRGSNTVMKYFGVDTSLKEGFALMVGAAALTGSLVSNMKSGNEKNSTNDQKDKSANEGKNTPKVGDSMRSVDDSISTKVSDGKTPSLSKNLNKNADTKQPTGASDAEINTRMKDADTKQPTGANDAEISTRIKDADTKQPTGASDAEINTRMKDADTKQPTGANDAEINTRIKDADIKQPTGASDAEISTRIKDADTKQPTGASDAEISTRIKDADTKQPTGASDAEINTRIKDADTKQPTGASDAEINTRIKDADTKQPTGASDAEINTRIKDADIKQPTGMTTSQDMQIRGNVDTTPVTSQDMQIRGNVDTTPVASQDMQIKGNVDTTPVASQDMQIKGNVDTTPVASQDMQIRGNVDTTPVASQDMQIKGNVDTTPVASQKLDIKENRVPDRFSKFK